MATRPARKASSTARGLGVAHRRNRDMLLRRHVDGNPCWWCARPMFRDAELNWDGRTLAADHTVPRALGGTRADRLLHLTCNEQRGDGRRDHERPALTGDDSDVPTRRYEPTENLAMNW